MESEIKDQELLVLLQKASHYISKDLWLQIVVARSQAIDAHRKQLRWRKLIGTCIASSLWSLLFLAAYYSGMLLRK